MYDWPEVRLATDALWAAIAAAVRTRGLDAPEALDRTRPPEDQWRDPDLLFSQTCGYPYATALRGTVRLVATPVYVAEGCEGPAYRSAIVTRAGDPARGLADLRGRTVAYNAPNSQSGYSALRAAVAPLASGKPFFSSVLETGGHLNSMQAVAEGDADCAAIDCVCWSMAEHYRVDLASRLKVIAWSDPAPALPFVTSALRSDDEVEILRASLQDVFADRGTAATRRALLIAGAEVLEDAAYDAILTMERDTLSAGYPELR
jgi:ABC-type phosphate/phosphonate transport system substrate-binding protein